MSSTSNSHIHLHAELLPNIRQLTLYVSLPSDSDTKNEDGDRLKPEISLSESRRAVTVSVGEEMETMKLPARVSESSRSNLRFPEQASSGHTGTTSDLTRIEFSFRMQVDKDEMPGLTKDEFVDDITPWMAEDMSTSTLVRCRTCSKVILDSTKHTEGWTWKNLPSGNWAEMMDFWHCHKPDPHEGHDHGSHDDKQIEDPNAVLKGYGAANQISASSGTILVDVASLLVAETDCNGLRKSQNEGISQTGNPSSRVYLECESCGATIGTEDIAANGWKLFKACIAVQRHSSSDPKTYPKETIVGAQLLEMIEREGIRRFVIHYGGSDGLLVCSSVPLRIPKTNPSEDTSLIFSFLVIKIWIFNPDVRYSSVNSNHSIAAQRAMKIFFQHVSDAEKILEPEQGKPASMSLEELYLPTSIYEDVYSALSQSNKMLPASARNFREWRVGFLNRLDRKHT
ncbi:hypothetical protein NFIA_069180 [Paecilomyces variotii No. 5]|uniref:Ubiquitin-conjugating enzyme E2-binding protein n=1 Tax=Byssochlamys spectabilis (strain No. 5 / NBRC 109023) TaxID=1356009 RepID=V5G5H4_BYSSN|nr:hypothetical protein NFIA_069180 [Paecilomyces variotii No. 5]